MTGFNVDRVKIKSTLFLSKQKNLLLIFLHLKRCLKLRRLLVLISFQTNESFVVSYVSICTHLASSNSTGNELSVCPSQRALRFEFAKSPNHSFCTFFSPDLTQRKLGNKSKVDDMMKFQSQTISRL